MNFSKLVTIFVFLIFSSSCTTIYYKTWEKLGKEKRDLLRDNLVTAKVQQQEIKGDFKDALTRLKEAYELPPSKVESFYNHIKSDYENLSEKSEDLSKRIEKVESIADDLFDEWQKEAQDFESDEYRKDSLAKLAKTKSDFKHMDNVLKKSEKSIAPILKMLKDQVLFLKHNLNAKALGPLKTEIQLIDSEIKKLTSQIETSISESESFIKTIESEPDEKD